MALSRIINPFLSSSGAGNASITSPSANTIAFSTTTTERMRIDSSGNLLIGTTTNTGVDTGSQRLVVNGIGSNGAALGVIADTVGRGIRVTDSSKTYTAVYDMTTSLATLGTNQSIPLAFITVGSERMRIDSSGNVGIGVTAPAFALNVKGSDYRVGLFETTSNLGPAVQIKGSKTYELRSTNTGAAEGSGLLFIYDKDNEASRLTINSGGVIAIKFAPTQVASADANTLDDYEEGTFTPSLTNTSGSLSYATQAGKYTKIGNTVVCNFWVQWSSGSLSGTTTYMSGLPFNSAGGNQRPSPSVRTAGFTVTGVIGGWIPNGDSRIQINVYNNGGQNDVSGSSVNSSGEFGGTVVYQVA